MSRAPMGPGPKGGPGGGPKQMYSGAKLDKEAGF